MLTFTISIRHTEPGGRSLMLGTEEKDIDWHVGESAPNEYLDDASLTVLSVYADGHELEHIIAEFKNMPHTLRKGRSCVWRGDMARFIFDNL